MGSIAKTVGKIAGSFIPGVGPLIGMGIDAVSGMIGKKKSGGGSGGQTPYAPNAAYTKPLTDFAGSVLPQAGANFGQASGFYSGVMADPSQATASGAADLAKQAQSQTSQLQRNSGRGGWQASSAAAIPQQVQAEGLRRQYAAKEGAAGALGQLGVQGGQLGSGVFGNLMQNELGGKQVGIGQGYLDLANKTADRDYYGNIGGSIFDILTGKNPINSDSPLGKLGGLLKGKLGGGGSPSWADPSQYD